MAATRGYRLVPQPVSSEAYDSEQPGVHMSLSVERLTACDGAAGGSASDDSSEGGMDIHAEELETARSGRLRERELHHLRDGEMFRVHGDTWPSKTFVCVMPTSDPDVYQLQWGKSQSATPRGGALLLSRETRVVQGLSLFRNTRWVGRSVPDSAFLTRHS